jgi:L-ascorbate metabolism protein UlaG (beta-lactamase superfamily)
VSESSALQLWWLGQSGYLICWNGFRLLIDLYLSDSLTKKYDGTDKPHVRMTERVVAPDALTKINAISTSHNHTDHLDAETLTPIFQNNPEAKLIYPAANQAFIAQRLGTIPTGSLGLIHESTVTLGPLTITGIAAAHNALDTDALGQNLYLGYVFQLGPWCLYHSGDTLLYEGLIESLGAFKSIDVALLPINGNRAERRVSGNLWGDEAAQLAAQIGARLVIPGHYDLFEFNTVTTDLFEKSCDQHQQPYKILQAGERLSLEK